jgi:hypothetical protein
MTSIMRVALASGLMSGALALLLPVAAAHLRIKRY